MGETNRLKIPTVEDTDNFSKDLWNHAFEHLDNICVAYVDLGVITYPAERENYQKEITNTVFRHYSIHCENPEDRDQWNTISLANFRFYTQDVDDHKYLVFQPEGIIPTIAVNLRVLGWY